MEKEKRGKNIGPFSMWGGGAVSPLTGCETRLLRNRGQGIPDRLRGTPASGGKKA